MDKLRLKDVLEIIYDTLSGNDVEEEDSAYLYNAIDHIDYEREEIVFTHEGAVYALNITEINPERIT